MKDVDIVIALDGCAVKKTGRNVEVMPKIKATQIVIKQNQAYSKKHIGLKLTNTKVLV